VRMLVAIAPIVIASRVPKMQQAHWIVWVMTERTNQLETLKNQPQLFFTLFCTFFSSLFLLHFDYQLYPLALW
jgi:hypothetical protein